jgi:hypothetical protein
VLWVLTLPRQKRSLLRTVFGIGFRLTPINDKASGATRLHLWKRNVVHGMSRAAVDTDQQKCSRKTADGGPGKQRAKVPVGRRESVARVAAVAIII